MEREPWQEDNSAWKGENHADGWKEHVLDETNDFIVNSSDDSSEYEDVFEEDDNWPEDLAGPEYKLYKRDGLNENDQ